MVFWFVVLQMRMRSPLSMLQTCALTEASTSLNDMSVNSEGSGETALMRRLA